MKTGYQLHACGIFFANLDFEEIDIPGQPPR